MAIPNPYLGEVVGTATLIVFGDGVVAGVLLNKSKAQNSGWIVITWAWGLAVFVGIITSLAVTGGQAHLNPAVTIGLWAGGFLKDWTTTQIVLTIVLSPSSAAPSLTMPANASSRAAASSGSPKTVASPSERPASRRADP